MDWSQVNWNAISAVATAAMAISTLAVIRQTAINHRSLLTQQSKEHRDRFKPICFLAPYYGVDPLNQRHELITVIDPKPANPSYGTVALRCTLQNVGLGPALNLRITFRSDNGDATDPWELSPLGPGEKFGSATTALSIPIRGDKLHLFAVAWQIWLEYEDVFGKKFKSVHRSTTFDVAPSTWQWSGPTATMRPVPWVTFQEN